MASKEDMNPFKTKERVQFLSEKHLLNKNKGTVTEILGNSVFVKFDSGVVACTSYKNLKRLKKS